MKILYTWIYPLAHIFIGLWLIIHIKTISEFVIVLFGLFLIWRAIERMFHEQDRWDL
jgi:hypothetical protein